MPDSIRAQLFSMPRSGERRDWNSSSAEAQLRVSA
jgi:hypothetical protein